MATTEPAGAGLTRLRFRPAVAADLAACHDLWRDGLNDYLVSAARMGVPEDNPGLTRLHAHVLATDPARFWVAERTTRAGARPGRLDGFGAAVRRDRLWYLSMLFIRPGEQARGIGRALLERLGAGPTGPGGPGGRADGAVRATATDAGQPVSNGLYASLGIVPRLPLFNLVGRPRHGADLPALPAGITTERLAPGDPAWTRDPANGSAHGAAQTELDALDGRVLGFTRPADHAWIRAEGRTMFRYRDDGGRLVGYGGTSEVGRIGPVTVVDPVLLAPVVGHLLGAIEPRGASAVWVAGTAGETFAMLVGAGLRIEDLPVLLCWDESFADWSRAIPISPGLL